MSETFTFKAEIKQLLDILVHSLYSEREIFLRELISNASDALNRLQFEMLTNRDVLDPDAELSIDVTVDEEAGTLTLSDNGIGMTHDDLVNNLGTIARSGAKQFIELLKDRPEGTQASDMIGQFGVGFYSVFMVADRVRVVSRSHHLDGQAWAWESDGSDAFTIEPSDKTERGTDIILSLKEDAKEFLQSYTVKKIITTHSDYITFPIYVADEEEPTNSQQAVWRKAKSEISEDDYNKFYQAMTLDFNEPLKTIHMQTDSPFQFYALLFIPGGDERNMFSPRKEPGLKLYARKVLIQDYSKDLLPEYLLQFIQGVVDSEDIPLNVSRETLKADPQIGKLKQTLTNKVLTELKRMAKTRKDEYLKLFDMHGRWLKQGLAMEFADREDLMELMYFPSLSNNGSDDWTSLGEYKEKMVEGQTDIYYIIGDDNTSAARSPHLDAFRRRGVDVLYFTDRVDPIMVMGLQEYQGAKLRSVDDSSIDLSNVGHLSADDASNLEPALEADQTESILERFRTVLGDRVAGVSVGANLVTSPARLVTDGTNPNNFMFRVNRLFDRNFELPIKTLEINPRHALIHNLNVLLTQDSSSALVDTVIEQVFETALLQDGIHPDPASMADRIVKLMQEATTTR
ncbi:MAG: molecular chaperone HtpG [Phototrophicaceae bacterium]